MSRSTQEERESRAIEEFHEDGVRATDDMIRERIEEIRRQEERQREREDRYNRR